MQQHFFCRALALDTFSFHLKGISTVPENLNIFSRLTNLCSRRAATCGTRECLLFSKVPRGKSSTAYLGLPHLAWLGCGFWGECAMARTGPVIPGTVPRGETLMLYLWVLHQSIAPQDPVRGVR